MTSENRQVPVRPRALSFQSNTRSSPPVGQPRQDSFDSTSQPLPQPPEWPSFSFNPMQDPSLLNTQGQYQAASVVVSAIRAKALERQQPEGPQQEGQQKLLPDACTIQVLLPDEQTEKAFRQHVEKANQVISANGIGNRIKHQIIRNLSGVTGKFHPIAIESPPVVSPNGQPGRPVVLTLNLSELSVNDMANLQDFIQKKIDSGQSNIK